MTNQRNTSLNSAHAAPYRRQVCPHCGGDLIGDGYTTVVHCELADENEVACAEPDANPIWCNGYNKPARYLETAFTVDEEQHFDALNDEEFDY